MGTSTFSGPVVSLAGFQSAPGTGFQTVTAAGAPSAGVYSGAGAPTLSAPQGSLYLNTTGNSTATRLYVNSNGSTAWVAVTTAS